MISPLDETTNLVEVEVLPDLKGIVSEIEPKVISNLGAALYARQLAIHLNVSIILRDTFICVCCIILTKTFCNLKACFEDL